MTKKLLGLIGHPLTHSFSQKYFSQKFLKENITDYEYRNFDLTDIDTLPDLLKQYPNLTGLNVTIPYKEKVLKYVDILSKEVQEIGAANTLAINKDKKVVAYNTDIYGFLESLKPFLKSHHRKALILGTGGASKAVAYALRQLHVEYLLVSRTPKGPNQIAYTDLNHKLVQSHKIVINTTPLGTYPDVDVSPDFPYDFITPEHLIYDLIYNPDKTRFLQLAEKKGASIYNGLNMLYLQAEKAWKIWLSNKRL